MRGITFHFVHLSACSVRFLCDESRGIIERISISIFRFFALFVLSFDIINIFSTDIFRVGPLELFMFILISTIILVGNLLIFFKFFFQLPRNIYVNMLAATQVKHERSF